MSAITGKTPGLNGDYRGSCVVCLQGTDTGLAVQGEAEAGIALLVAMGVPMDEATEIAADVFAEKYNCTDGQVPGGIITFPIRVCGSCCEKSGTGMRPGLLANMPVYSLGGN